MRFLILKEDNKWYMMQDEILLLNAKLKQKSQAHKKFKPSWQARLQLQ